MSLNVFIPESPPGAYRITQTSVAVTATSQQVLPANPSRRYLQWMVVGTADVTVTAGADPAVVGQGIVYQSTGSGKQGASETFQGGAPITAFQCIAAASGSTLIIWEGM